MSFLFGEIMDINKLMTSTGVFRPSYNERETKYRITFYDNRYRVQKRFLHFFWRTVHETHYLKDAHEYVFKLAQVYEYDSNGTEIL